MKSNDIFIFISVTKCPSLSASVNGHYVCDKGFIYGSQCSFSCNQGYILQGVSLSSCDQNGDWSSAAPTCTGIFFSSQICDIIHKNQLHVHLIKQ